MKSYDQLLGAILRAEKESGLYEAEIMGVPLWRLLRFEVRTKYVSRRSNFRNKTHERKLRVVPILRGYISSFWKLAIDLVGRRKTKNIVFAFPRLTRFGDAYLDKFTDPVIELSALHENCVVLQRGLFGRHLYPRYRGERVLESDLIDYSAIVLGVALSPLFLLIHYKGIVGLYRKAKDFFDLDRKYLLRMSSSVGIFVIQYYMMLGLLKLKRPHRIFVVNRRIFAPAITAAKKLGITVYEFQHGEMQSESILYSGSFHPLIDPDYFLTFGEAWRGPQLGIPDEKVRNIGWAFSEFISDYQELEQYSEDHVLVVSAPIVTSVIYKLVLELSERFPSSVFHVRLHPQEGLAEHQLSKLQSIPNVLLDNRELDSALAVSQYSKIIGENSTVLYEGLAIGKQVGRLDMHGFYARRVAGIDEEGFEYLHNMSDLERFLNVDEGARETSRLRAYDSFNASLVNELLKEQ